tara:strand:- start:3616 stop:4047 length:432 start_codon:yes stop_codon:yes gene_type:complete
MTQQNAWSKARNYTVNYNGMQIGYTTHGKQNIEECLVEMREGFDEAEANDTHFSATLSLSFGGSKADIDEADSKARNFIALFPKYVRLATYSWSSAEWTRNPQGGFSVEFGVSYVAARDGKANETGRKRFNKFCDVLRHWNMV